LDSLTEIKLLGLLEEIGQYLSHDKPDEAVYTKKCERCAYYVYCYI